MLAGADQHEDPVGAMRQCGPDLLPVHDKRIAVEHGCRPQAGEIRSRIGFGISLAPDVLAGQDTRQIVGFLLFSPVLDQQRADETDAMIGNAGTTETPPFLDVDHVLARRETHAAILLRPGWSQPAFRSQRAIPVCDLVEQRALLAHVAQTARAVVIHPCAEGGPELFVGTIVPVDYHQDASLKTGSRFSMKARIASLESSCWVISTVRFCSKRYPSLRPMVSTVLMARLASFSAAGLFFAISLAIFIAAG